MSLEAALTSDVWRRILELGHFATDYYYPGIAATALVSHSSPALLPRERKLGPILPFTILTARLLEPSPNPDDLRSELVEYIGPDDSDRRAGLMALPRQRSWASVVEEFVRHQDRKYTFDSEGGAVRKHVLVSETNLVGLGKEANRVEDARVLGLRVAGGRAKTYIDPDPFKGSATEVARRLGVSRRTVFWRRRKLGSVAWQSVPGSSGVS